MVSIAKLTLDEAIERFKSQPDLPGNAATLLTVAETYWNDDIIGDESYADCVRLVRDQLRHTPSDPKSRVMQPSDVINFLVKFDQNDAFGEFLAMVILAKTIKERGENFDYDHLAEAKTETPIVVAFGNPFDGLKVAGPFTSNDEAAAYGERSDADWWVVRLQNPNT